MNDDEPTKKLPEDADDSSGRPDEQFLEMTDPSYKMHKDMQRLFTLFNSLNENFNSLNEKVEKRLQDTMPIWEAVHSQLNELDEKLMTRIDELQTKMQDEFHRLNKKIEILTQDVIDVRTENRLLEDRITKIEQNPS